jgi:hypothetical protein
LQGVVPILERCVTLGREFRRREMSKHVRLLTDFYFATRDGKPCTNTWSSDFVDDWLATLQLPPFEHVLELHPAPFLCATCNADGGTPSRRTELTFPGGGRMMCNSCHRRWIEHWPQ